MVPPQSGQVFLFHSDPADGQRFNWKKDLLSFTMRKNQNAVQENRLFLKVDGRDEIVSSQCKGAEPDLISRRAFWLVSRPDLVLV